MSGGYFNHQEMHLLDMGEKLRGEDDPVLKATGNTLIRMSEILQRLDRMYCGDESDEGVPVALNQLRELMPFGKPLEAIVEEAEQTLASLQRELSDAKATARAKDAA